MEVPQFKLNSSEEQDSVTHNENENYFLNTCSDLSRNNSTAGEIGVKKQLVKSASFNSRIPVLLSRTRQRVQTNCKIPVASTSPDDGSKGDTPTTTSSGISSGSDGSPVYYTPMSTLSWLDTSLIRTLEIFTSTSTPNIEDIIKGFPSTKTQHQFVNWTDIKNAKVSSMDEQISRAFQTARVLDHVRQTFNTNGEMLENSEYIKRNHKKDEVSIYLAEYFQYEMRKEDKYIHTFKHIFLNPKDLSFRKKRIDWIFEAGSKFEYHLDTIYMAVYFMDAYLHCSKISDRESWIVHQESCFLAVASLHLAAKLEEVRLIRVQDVLETFDYLKEQIPNSRIKHISQWERKLLSAFSYRVSPPSPYVMIDIIIQSGFPGVEDSSGKLWVQELSQELLLFALNDVQYFSIKPSTKARLALEIAVEYVMYNWNIYTVADELHPDYHKVRRASSYCEMAFRALLSQQQLQRS